MGLDQTRAVIAWLHRTNHRLVLAACSPGALHASLPIGQAASKALGPRQPPANQPHSPNKGDTYQERLLYTAEKYLSRMTLDEKLGQMFLIETSETSYDVDVDTMVRTLHAGALIIYAQNMQTPQQLKSYIATIQAHASIPLIVSIDEEGGVVDRLGYNNFDPPLAGGAGSQCHRRPSTRASKPERKRLARCRLWVSTPTSHRWSTCAAFLTRSSTPACLEMIQLQSSTTPGVPHRSAG